MRNYWLLGAAIVMVTSAGTPASADPRCNAADAVCVDTNDGDAGSGNPLVDVTGMLPAQGIVAAGDDPGYVFFDGDTANDDPLDGYLGINANDEALISASDQGDFRRQGGNISPPAPPALPELPGGAPELPALPVALPLP